MQLDQFLDQRQTDAGALVGARLRAFDAMKTLEQARQLVRRRRRCPCPRPRARRGPSSRCSVTDTLACERELERIRQQVEDDLLPHLAVDMHRLRRAAGSRTSNSSPARSMAERKLLARSSVSAARSTGSKEAVTRPASMRAKSSSELTSLSRRSELRCATSSCARSGAGSVRDRRARLRSGPSISVSGVRNSWLTFEKKAVLARSISASAAARRRSSS